MIEGKIIPGFGDLGAAFAIRRAVFVEEQGFAAESEFDEIDAAALHVLVTEGGRPAATARLYQQGGEWHIGRVAVMGEFRGKGIGSLAMRMLMQKAEDLGASVVHVGAQRRAEAFYAALGFSACGEEYLEEGVAHVPMKAAAGAGAAHGCRARG